MIYLKINKNVYNDYNIDNIKKEYPLDYKRILAIRRIICRALKNELQKYPDIDIVISNKKQKNSLGRFCINKYHLRPEFKFIQQGSGNPYIILYVSHILAYFYNHKVKGIKEVFFHEFYHYKQWLNAEPLRHDNIIRPCDNAYNVESNIKRIAEALNNAVK